MNQGGVVGLRRDRDPSYALAEGKAIAALAAAARPWAAAGFQKVA